MFVDVIIFLGLFLALACPVKPGHIETYAEASSIPPPSDHSHSTPHEQYHSQTTQNDHESGEILIYQNGTVEHDGFSAANGSFGLQKTSNETHHPTGLSTYEPNEQFVERDPPRIQGLLQAEHVPEFQPFIPNTHAMIVGTKLNGFPPSNAMDSTDSEPVTLSSLPMLWHAGIYSKYYMPYMQICGGTLVTTKAVISAAHCFWGDVEGVLPASSFVVAAGKRYRPWNDSHDRYSQKSDVEAIHIPMRYRDAATSYQEDIAVVLLSWQFRTNFALKPVCVNFGEDFDDEQLQKGNMGAILGWGLTEEDGNPSPVLNYLELPAVDIEDCLASAGAGADFQRYITSDKICAGVTTGKAVCRGDSGGGLVFFDRVGPTHVPYLRGVASTAPRNEHRCNAHALAAFTHVRAHRDFLRRHIPGLEKECKNHYPYADAILNRSGQYQHKSQNLMTDQPARLNCNCNCFCNNTKPSHDEVTFNNY